MIKLENATVVFSGFTDPALENQLVKDFNAKVRKTVSGVTTIVVAKSLERETKAIEYAKENKLGLFALDDFIATFGLKKESGGSNESKADMLPPGLVLKAKASLPIDLYWNDWQGRASYKSRDIKSIYNQGAAALANIFGKKHGVEVRGVKRFLGYSWEEDCFIFILKVKSMADDATWGSFDLVAAEVKFNGKLMSFLGYRVIEENVPFGRKVDAVGLIKEQYGNDLFVIGENMYKKEKEF